MRDAYAAPVEARFDPRRILKDQDEMKAKLIDGVEARFDPRRILKGDRRLGQHHLPGVEARFDPRRILKVAVAACDTVQSSG